MPGDSGTLWTIRNSQRGLHAGITVTGIPMEYQGLPWTTEIPTDSRDTDPLFDLHRVSTNLSWVSSVRAGRSKMCMNSGGRHANDSS